MTLQVLVVRARGETRAYFNVNGGCQVRTFGSDSERYIPADLEIADCWPQALNRPDSTLAGPLAKLASMSRSLLSKFHLSKEFRKDFLGGVKEILTLARYPLRFVPIPGLPLAIDAILNIISAVEVSLSA